MSRRHADFFNMPQRDLGITITVTLSQVSTSQSYFPPLSKCPGLP